MPGKYLMYSSLGDRTRFQEFWLNEPEKRHFDLWATYYGERDDEPYRPHVDRYFRERGSKFQNFYKVYLENRDEVQEYDAVFIIDDDIEIGTEDINHLFEIQRLYDLWILQPAFSLDSVLSHRVTAKIPGAFLHYTNFVETNAPLFSIGALIRFMKQYDPELIGWGADYFAVWVNGINARSRYAVVDAVPCVHPERQNPARNEISQLGSTEQLIANFEQIARRHGVSQWTPVTHAVVYTGSLDSPYADPRKRIQLHDYPVRIRRIAVSGSAPERWLCTVSGESEQVVVNESALAILSLCDGHITLCMILVRLRRALGLSVSDMPDLRASVEAVLADYVTRGWLRAYNGPHFAEVLSGVGAPEANSPSCLEPADIPRSIQVINLDRRQDRWLAVSTGLARAGVPDTRRMPAVDAAAYPSIDAMLEDFGDCLHPRYRDIDGFDVHDHRFRAKTACALSHLTALRNILASGDAGWHIILEDDNQLLHDWSRLLDSLSDTLTSCQTRPGVILLSDRVGAAGSVTGIGDSLGTDAYAIHSSACAALLKTIRFLNGAFHINYSLDDHYKDLCDRGQLDITILENGPWIHNFGTGHDSDIKKPN